jgi:hypothetical protein
MRVLLAGSPLHLVRLQDGNPYAIIDHKLSLLLAVNEYGASVDD